MAFHAFAVQHFRKGVFLLLFRQDSNLGASAELTPFFSFLSLIRNRVVHLSGLLLSVMVHGAGFLVSAGGVHHLWCFSLLSQVVIR